MDYHTPPLQPRQPPPPPSPDYWANCFKPQQYNSPRNGFTANHHNSNQYNGSWRPPPHQHHPQPINYRGAHDGHYSYPPRSATATAGSFGQGYHQSQQQQQPRQNGPPRFPPRFHNHPNPSNRFNPYHQYGPPRFNNGGNNGNHFRPNFRPTAASAAAAGKNPTSHPNNNGASHHKPWITPELKELIRQRNVLQKRVELFHNPEEWSEFKLLRNKVTTMLNTAKFDYEIKICSEPKSLRLYYCDTCDKTCFNQVTLDEHKAEHIICKLDGCTFTAHPKVVLKHIQMQHATNLYQRLQGYKTEEEIRQWRAERKKNFPTEENVIRKRAERVERRVRGERIPKLPPFKYSIDQAARRVQNKYRQQQHRGGHGRGRGGGGGGGAYQQQHSNNAGLNPLITNSANNSASDFIHSLNKSPMLVLKDFYPIVKVGDKRKLIGKKLTLWKKAGGQKKKVQQAIMGSREREKDERSSDEEEEEDIARARAAAAAAGVANSSLANISISDEDDDDMAVAVPVVKPAVVESTNQATKTETDKKKTEGGSPAPLTGLVAYSSDDSEGEIHDDDDADADSGDSEPPDEIAIQHQPTPVATAAPPGLVGLVSKKNSVSTTAKIKKQPNSLPKKNQAVAAKLLLSTPATTKRKKTRAAKVSRKGAAAATAREPCPSTSNAAAAADAIKAPTAPVPSKPLKSQIASRLKKIAVKKTRSKDTKKVTTTTEPVPVEGKQASSKTSKILAPPPRKHKDKKQKLALGREGEGGEGASRSRSKWGGNKGVKAQVKPRPRWRPPTLLERLLNEEIEREGNYLLQACRFIVENNFFDGEENKSNGGGGGQSGSGDPIVTSTATTATVTPTAAEEGIRSSLSPNPTPTP